MLYREGVRRSRGEEARIGNILIAKILSECLKPTLGPRGMSKLLVDKFGEMAVTSDGATILDKMDVYHPTAKVFKEITKTVEKTVGDGTKTVAILVGELLKRAEDLIGNKLHVNTIIRGYEMAYEVALRNLRKVSMPVEFEDKELLKRMAATMLSTRTVGAATEHLANLAVEAVQSVAERKNGRVVIYKENVQIVKQSGKSLLESELIIGTIVNRRVVHDAMPKSVKNARIAVLDMALKIDEFKHLQPMKQEIVIRDAPMVRRFLDEEARVVSDMVNKVLSVDANVVFCRKRIGKLAKDLLAKAGVMAAHRLLKQEDIERVAKATGATMVADLADLTRSDLGRAALVEERKIGEEKMIVIEGGEKSRVSSILLRAGLERQLDETEHALNDTITSLISLTDCPSYVPGGGAVEEELAIAVRKEALKYPGKEQLAMLAAADTLEILPISLAKNAGFDPIEILAELRMWHEKGMTNYGINAFTGKVEDVAKIGIIEPLKVKEQVLKTCIETASMILRVDNIVDTRYAKRPEKET
ncbi:MAG: thermosome subunit beta [Candidatus Bathyarchaeia archaeon]